MKNYKFYPARAMIVLLIISLMTGCGLTTVGDPPTATSSAPTLPPPPSLPSSWLMALPPGGLRRAIPNTNRQPARRQPSPTDRTEVHSKWRQSHPVRQNSQHRQRCDCQRRLFEIYARDINGNRLYQETTMVKYIFPPRKSPA